MEIRLLPAMLMLWAMLEPPFERMFACSIAWVLHDGSDVRPLAPTDSEPMMLAFNGRILYDTAERGENSASKPRLARVAGA